MVSARDIEHMSTGSGHAYNDYRSYGAGPVANLSQTECSTDRHERSRGSKPALCTALQQQNIESDSPAAWHTAILAPLESDL